MERGSFMLGVLVLLALLGLGAAGEPMVKVYARPRAEGGKENILVCFVRGFYPEPLDIDLLKNGEPMPNVKYLSFEEKGQYLLYAPFSRTSGASYSCRVEHSSMPEPRTYQWEPDC